MEKTRRFLTAALVFLVLNQSISSIAITNLTTDQSALLFFKASIILDPYNMLADNWSTTSLVCSWVGITCGVLHERVISLNLSDMGLTGSLSPHLSNLSFLSLLDISFNHFYGQIPKEFACLHRLKQVNFGYNNFVGDLNSYSWFGNLPDLQYLLLHHNNFTGTIGSSLCNMSKLEGLTLGFNSLHGNIPDEIGKLSNLKFLNLENNQITGSIPSAMFFNMSSLQSIDLTANNFYGEIPSSLYKCRKLQYLSLSFNSLNGNILREIGNLTMLKELYIGHNDFKGGIPLEVGYLVNLEIFSAVSSSLTGAIPSFLFNMSSLRVIHLTNNRLSGSLPLGIQYDLPFLEELQLQSNQLSGQFPPGLWACKALKRLLLSFNDFTGSISKNIGNLTSLRDLHLGDNKLTGALPEEIGNLNLEILSIPSAGLTGLIPSQIFNKSTRRFISLSPNQLSGHLPSSFGLWLPNLKIDLSWNQLSGEIPSTIGGAQTLVTLSLAGNKLQGPIPQSLGNLISLEFLDLSNNNLSRGIPQSLEALRNLQHLNLSFNNLQGEIPTGGHFANFTAVSFMQNSGLCGAPRLQVPPCKTNKSRKILDLLTYILPTISFAISVAAFVWMRYRNMVLPIRVDSMTRLWRGFSDQELVQATNLFSESNILGTGSFSSVVTPFLQENYDVMEIPFSFLECMPMLQVLDLSHTSIKSLPASISGLVSLQELFLRGCELLTELPPEIGALSKLQVLDLEGTELMYLPKEISRLTKLECLKVSLYGYGKSYREVKQICKRIPAGLLASLCMLKALSIDVNPDDDEWVADVKNVTYELLKLKELMTLKLYFPEVGQLKGITSVRNFKFTVGHHKQCIISCLPHGAEEEFEKQEKYLKYINGKYIPIEIQNALKYTCAFFLERHWTVKKLSEFGNENMVELKFCLLVECNELQTIIDGDQTYESGIDKKLVFDSLEYLGIHCMMNLRSIWEGPIGKGCLSKLKYMALHSCPNLTSIFTTSLLGNLNNLDELIIEDCPQINSLVSQESLCSEPNPFLPSLRKISLLDLPELVSISSGLLFAPKLERIIIYACAMLESLSPMEFSGQKDYMANVFVELRRDASLMDQLAESGNSIYNQLNYRPICSSLLQILHYFRPIQCQALEDGFGPLSDAQLSIEVFGQKVGYIRGLGRGRKPSITLSGKRTHAQLERDNKVARREVEEQRRINELVGRIQILEFDLMEYNTKVDFLMQQISRRGPLTDSS
ncbi:LRR receptor-like serine/threonine-protein kinase EFR [Camellia lanceoleosa]|uniref:LRR receptor-like serine/threonine-protein kinase EFR n=1 Tax=Camellia lanceoleosa TaxID=1840588 RepID=A0ACC0GSJ2_9ERIC|nr:LRR receptor-like serine/threonine-protein kinase EFR [Camellia lanceoleosa]